MRTSKRNKNKHLAKKSSAHKQKKNQTANEHHSEHNNEPQNASVKELNTLAISALPEKNIPRRSHITYPITHRNTRLVLIILSCYAVFSLWIMQNSVNAYYLQTYHRQSPLVALNDFSVWRWGGYVGDALYTWRDYINNRFETANQYSVQQHNQKVNPQTQVDSDTENLNQTVNMDNAQQQVNKNQNLPVKNDVAHQQDDEQQSSLIHLTTNDEIFFAGDSMMQGVAPHVQKYLQQHRIKSVNLSKQSTGLSYPKFFNWPQTIKDTLTNNANIKVLVIFLGPNDPWDIINPRNGKYIKFQSEEWEQTYRSRMADILNTAKEHQVKVIWISPPNMKKALLNQQMTYLNQIMQKEVELHDAIWVDSRPLVGGKDDTYNDYLVKNGKTIKMRSSDGIHFSIQGQKEMASIIQQHFKIAP